MVLIIFLLSLTSFYFYLKYKVWVLLSGGNEHSSTLQYVTRFRTSCSNSYSANQNLCRRRLYEYIVKWYCIKISYRRWCYWDWYLIAGISILFSTPEHKEPNLFSFLSPLSTDVWMYMATAYLAVSLMLFLQAR